MDSPTSESKLRLRNAQLEDGSQTFFMNYSEKFQELTRWDTWLETVFGCGTGGAIYLFLATAVTLWFDPSFVVILVAWPFLIIVGFLAGAIFGILATIVVLPINESLGRPLKTLWVSFVVGGLAGFLPFLLVLLTTQGLQNTDWISVGVFGPFPLMVLGHTCAYWMTEKAVNDHNQRFGVVKHEVSQAGIRSSRFGITHIMILTIWMAVGFSLLSCFSPEFRLSLTMFYLPVQSAAALAAIFVISLVSRVRHYKKRNVSAPDH